MNVRAALRRRAVKGLRTVRRFRGHRPPGPGSPPATPPGWVVAPPDFVGIGAQKAGTSWWHHLLLQHPDVHTAPGVPKELHFFDEHWDRRFGPEDVDRYARYFPRPPERAAQAGEWTPGYLIDFWTPGLLRRAAPEARLLVLLRDPVERYRSSMAHTDDLSRAPLSRLDAMGAFQRGLYAQQLKRVFASFPAEQVLVLQYERCREDPAGELARTFGFLGLAPHDLPADAFAREVNPTTARKLELSADDRAALARAYAPDLAELAGLVAGLDLDLWPSARQALR